MARDAHFQPQSCVLFVDAYDSFSENIIALLRQLLRVTVVSIKVDERLESSQFHAQNQTSSTFDAIVIGPGPGSPDSASDTGHVDQIWNYATAYAIPVLGICLGFQSLCTRFGLSVTQLDLPCHGHARQVLHDNQDVFEDVGSVMATSYNSLGVLLPHMDGAASPYSLGSSVDGISRPGSSCSNATSVDQTILEGSLAGSCFKASLRIIAWNSDKYVMAVKHTTLPFWGFQFHPESCLSNDTCQTVLCNWWKKVQIYNQEFRRPLAAQIHDHPKAKAATSSASDSSVFDISQQLDPLVQHCARELSYVSFSSPVSRSKLADLCQSLSAAGATAILESSRRGRYSIYAFPDEMTWLLQQHGHKLYTQRRGIVNQIISAKIEKTMEAIEAFILRRLATGGDPNIPFWGGFIGTISYEAGLDLAIPDHHQSGFMKKTRLVQDLSLMWVDRSVVLDNETSQLYIQTLRNADSAWLSELTSKIQTLAKEPNLDTPFRSIDTATTSMHTSSPSQHDYVSQIRSCKADLYAGNSYELCLTTSATVTTTLPAVSVPYGVYKSLQSRNPASYSAFLSLDTTTVLSSSPEQFLSWPRSQPHLDMMPMKGTLAKNPNVTSQQAKKLLCTPKEEAENLMIADLIRHDLHRSLAPNGTVEVKSLYELVETENTYQLISHVRGHMSLSSATADLSFIEQERRKSEQIMQYGHKALRTSLPPGSMTGAPKLRSCSILSELERRNRGLYSGVIGYFDVGGGGCWSVAIRCAFSDQSEDKIVDDQKMQRWHIGAGGAITVLSDEEQEWDEMKLKMNGVLKGFGIDDEASFLSL